MVCTNFALVISRRMFRVKRIHTFVLQSFLPTFVMTFLICDFILVMQLIWRVADQIMGKGIGMSVYLEFIYYASASLLPTTLPLAILLASLMTFGNFGEKLELLAMKAAGISLFNIMSPLIVLIVVISGLSYVFQDRYIPKVQVKFDSLLLGMQQKSPALSIPAGAFYSEIENMTIYVKNKDVEKKLLKDVMIYDFSEGFDKVSVTLADSARLRMTEDKLNLVMTLYHGEGFSNFDQEQAGTQSVPYRRETFRTREVIIPFDDNFSRMDESYFGSSYRSKNSHELRGVIDSLGGIIDSVQAIKQRVYTEQQYLGRIDQPRRTLLTNDSIAQLIGKPVPDAQTDSMFRALPPELSKPLIEEALRRVQTCRSDFEFQEAQLQRENNLFRRSGIEYFKKYFLSIACLVFFFIGAPLGSIIRKGGIGMPAVVSVVLFIVYYIVDTKGQKLVKTGTWDAFYGMALSTAVLLPLGIFLTVKSIKDSAIFNWDSYVAVFKKYTRFKVIGRYFRMKWNKLFNYKWTKKLNSIA